MRRGLGSERGTRGLRNGPALTRGWAGGKRELAQEKEKETGRARGAAWAAEGGERELGLARVGLCAGLGCVLGWVSSFGFSLLFLLFYF